MSGGSYDYVSRRLEEAAETLRARHPTRPHVVALAHHLERVGAVLHDIEWADSGDTSWDEALDAAIRTIVAPAAELATAAEAVTQALTGLQAALDRAQRPAAEDDLALLHQLATSDHAAWDALRVDPTYTRDEWLAVVRATRLDSAPLPTTGPGRAAARAVGRPEARVAVPILPDADDPLVTKLRAAAGGAKGNRPDSLAGLTTADAAAILARWERDAAPGAARLAEAVAAWGRAMDAAERDFTTETAAALAAAVSNLRTHAVGLVDRPTGGRA